MQAARAELRPAPPVLTGECSVAWLVYCQRTPRSRPRRLT